MSIIIYLVLCIKLNSLCEFLFSFIEAPQVCKFHLSSIGGKLWQACTVLADDVWPAVMPP